jgi:hypothetical protein
LIGGEFAAKLEAMILVAKAKAASAASDSRRPSTF